MDTTDIEKTMKLIEELKDLITVRNAGGEDYRTLGSSNPPPYRTYFSPLEDRTSRDVFSVFKKLTKSNFLENIPFVLLPRMHTLNIPFVSTNEGVKIALFRFDDLCAQKLGKKCSIIYPQMFEIYYI